jgi:rhodanese-related sulfurtransferase
MGSGGMKKYLFPVLIVCLLFLNDSYAQEHANPEIPRINADLAYLKYKNGSVIIIDAMSRITYTKYHILGAINLPADEGPRAQERIRAAKLLIPFDKEIIVYCD